MPAIMIDLETLDVVPGAVILSIGAVKFDPCSADDPHSPFYVKLDVSEQSAAGRTICDETLEWWSGQVGTPAFDEAFSEDDRSSVTQFLTDLRRYCVGANDIWAQGPVFDIVMLENMFRQFNLPIPWQYWQIRDSRTIERLTAYKKENSDLHNALADAYSQAKMVQKVYSDLGVKK